MVKMAPRPGGEDHSARQKRMTQNAFTAPGPTIDQLYEERAEIDRKIEDVEWFKKTLAFQNYETDHANLVDAQLSAMRLYSGLLTIRIDQWEFEP